MNAYNRIITATPGEGAAIALLMQQAIRQGGVADHHGDPAVVDAWTANKHQEQIEHWISDPALYVSLGFHRERPVAVGLAAVTGEICQCVVQPEHWRRGLGRALMGDLEQTLRNARCQRAMLYSTRSAEGFFRRLGYTACGPCTVFHGLHLQPMQKSL